jgi:OOP family OmpA-OmpF porin
MKRLLLIPALMLGTVAMADQYKYEISPMIGYNFAEGNFGIKHDSYLVGGLEAQANTVGSKLSPELSVFQTRNADYKAKANGDTDVTRLAFNGVYTFDAINSVVPFAKLGAGYETVNNEIVSNESGFFADAGVGAKVALTDAVALKLEAIYMAKPGGNNAGSADNNLMTLVGLTFAFGGETPAKVEPVAAPVVEPVVAPVVEPVAAVVDGDDDNDGVLNSKDICPDTPARTAVNSDGCSKIVQLNINFETDSYVVKEESMEKISTYADFLTKYTNYSAKIVGHTDSTGTNAHNQKLSENRANEVVKQLVAKGVNSNQLTSEGMGETKPVATNKTNEGRAQNSRIEAELTKN